MKKILFASASLFAVVAAAAFSAVALNDSTPLQSGSAIVVSSAPAATAADTSSSPAMPSAVSMPSAGSAASAAVASVPAGYTLAYSDEFNQAALNTNDWYYRITGLYAGGYVRSQNVSLDGSSLNLKFGYEDVTGDGAPDYTGGGIMSRNNFGYGYYEIRAKLFNATSGLHTSFWSMGIRRDISGAGGDPRINQDIDAGLQPEQNQLYEIDAFEHDSPDSMGIGDFKQSTSTTPHRRPPSTGASLGVNFGDWNVYGFEYTPMFTKFYVNGDLKFTIDNTTNGYVFTPQTFWLTALRTGNASNTSILPGYSQFDYFRYYNKPQIGANLIGNGSFDATPTSLFQTWNPPAWIETYDKPASYLVSDDFYNGTRSLIQTSTANFVVSTKQNLKFIPNGTYRLTARVKSSGGQSTAVMRALNYGGAEQRFDIPAASDWTLVTLDNIPVTNHQATVAFSSTGTANQWLKIDDVQFVQLN